MSRIPKAINEESLYDRVVHHIFFSGEMAPSSKVVEKRLAEQLGVSRIPIREALGKLAGQGLLVGEHSGQGVRLRQYTAEEIRQLYEVRELLEGGAARAAARSATDLDIARMEMICKETEQVQDPTSMKWGDLDHAFHAAIADASHNDRIARLLKLLLTECHYVFFYHLPSKVRLSKVAPEEAHSRLEEVLSDHRTLLDLVKSGNADDAERKAREDMRKSSMRFTQAMLSADLQR